MQSQSLPVSMLSAHPRVRPRTAVVTSADLSFRQRLVQILTGLRWQVREAEGGAQAWAEAETALPEAMIVDSWLPDLELNDFLKDFRAAFPQVDLVAAGGKTELESPRGPYRQELLYALRHSQDGDTAVWNAAPTLADGGSAAAAIPAGMAAATRPSADQAIPVELQPGRLGAPSAPGPTSATTVIPIRPAPAGAAACAADRLPELVGNAACMLEVSRRIRLVAPRSTPVLIKGPTGSGKELVAMALHRLSTRSRKPFVTINCAAIPEALLESELFGHTRGAFTGAVQGRSGRIEAANGGTVFLDEIGEMPLTLQSKLLRFVERGELQRVGDNETVNVDVRILAATHRRLSQLTLTGEFRADLYYRLAVFLIRTPALIDHLQDVPLLVEHILAKLGRETPLKRLDDGALARLMAHDWPGNVRELEHVLERAVILAGDAPVVTAAEVEFGLTLN